MPSTLVINARPYQTRVALLEDDQVVELHMQRGQGRGLAGNVYLGSVQRVIPGMQAAFVEIGLERAAFLHADDLPRGGAPEQRLEKRLQAGQEITVQVAKEPAGVKGARVTGQITLPGRNLVLMPFAGHVGVSRRILDADERARLKAVFDDILPPGMGCIVRTAGEGEHRDALQSELDFLVELWENIKRKPRSRQAPCLLHKDLSVGLRAVRDLKAADLARVVIDDPEEHGQVLEFAHNFGSELAGRVELYQGSGPIFEAFGVESALKKALGRKVWLRSGGYIVIEPTEALTVVDVNTGRYVGGRDLEETILNTNLEAAAEVARQLRLRDIGGLIVIDFIDMEETTHQSQVVDYFKNQLSRDRAKTVVLGMSALGLVEMTRKRVRTSLGESLKESCYLCSGAGDLLEVGVVCCDIFRALENLPPNAGRVRLEVHPRVAAGLTGTEAEALAQVEHERGLKVSIFSDPGLHQERFVLS